MKRPIYEVKVEGRPPVKKLAWNSALRAMEAEIRETMQPGQTATRGHPGPGSPHGGHRVNLPMG